MAASKLYQPIDIHAKTAGAWPDTIPPMTDDEAVRAVRRIWRWAEGESFSGPITVSSGNRNNWTYWAFSDGKPGGSMLALRVNPSKGWREFAHDLSHLFFYRANPGARPHDKGHARFEAKLIREILTRGWLEGKLKTEDAAPAAKPSLDDKRAHKLALIECGIQRWEKRRASAERRISTLNKKARYYRKALGVA